MPATKRFTRLRVEALEDRCTPSTYTVTNLQDAGQGSLRQAVLNANNHAGADTVVFRDGLEGTIKLTSGEMAITGGLFIDGPGANKIMIDGNRDLIFLVSGTAGNVKIDGLTMFNGHGGAEGGAISNGANLTLVGVVITGNSGGGDGGAITNYYNLTILQSKIIGNQAQYSGGAIVSIGSVLIDQSNISGNRCGLAGLAGYGRGGGIYSSHSSLTVRKFHCVQQHRRRRWGRNFGPQSRQHCHHRE